MNFGKSLIIIFLGFLLTGCGYTVLKNYDVADSAKTHAEYTFDGLWTKWETNSSGGDIGFATYHLLFVSNGPSGGIYGASFDNPPNISGNYTVSSDTLTLRNDYNLQKFSYYFKGKSLMLSFISLERFDEKFYPLKLEGNWSRTYK